LRVFQNVARLGSLSQASRECGVSQPAVTQAIAKLEERLSAPLFERCQSGCFLTQYGHAYLARTDRFFNEVENSLLEPLVGPPFTEDRLLKCTVAKITATHVRTLMAIAEHQSVEAAAIALDISGSSLTRAARGLEGVLRRTLFHPSAHGLSATKISLELARRFRLACRELAYGSEEIAGLRGKNESRVVVGTLPLFPVDLLARSVDDLLKAYPGTKILILEGSYLGLLADLRAGKIDFLVSVLRKPDWVLDVDEEPLFEDPYAVIARRGHPLAQRSDITLQDLARFEWVLPEAGTPRRTAFDRMFRTFDPKPAASIETRSMEFQRGMLSTSDRVSLVTMHEALFETRVGMLGPLPFAPPVTRRADGVATRANWQPTGVQLAFLDLLRRNARRRQADVLELNEPKTLQMGTVRRVPRAVQRQHAV
jgi:DNA-binding transcriptional LysR family regulator